MKDKKPFEQGPIDGLTPELMEGYAKGSLSPEMMARIKQYLNLYILPITSKVWPIHNGNIDIPVSKSPKHKQ